MLKSLDYTVEFPTTGRSFANHIEFAPGLTAITGRNEAGKSLILEMIAYCLFGKDALRGLASDYRNLTATLSLMIGDKDVLIERKPRTETLFVDGQTEAVGAQAINAVVPKLLGFGLEVFNIACASQQGDIGRLTEMKPTPRRQMVEQLVGLDILEQTEKDCRAEARAKETLATSLVQSVAVPVEPVQPDDYESSLLLEEQITQLNKHQAERAQLLLVKEPVAPVEPEAPAETDVEALEKHEAERQAVLQARARLEGQLAAIPEPRFSREELEKAVAYQQYQEEVRRRGPKPDVEIALLKDMEKALDVQQRAGEQVACPNCDHQFHLGISPEDETWLDHVVPLTRSQITSEFRRHQLWAEPLDDVAEFILPNLQQEILAHARADERRALAEQLAELVLADDRSGALRIARAYRQQRALYEDRLARFDSEMDGWRAGQSRLAELPDRSAELAVSQRRLVEARAYERAVDAYSAERDRYDAIVAQCRDAEADADGYGRGALALRNTRTKVKQELAPSLAKAASTLLAAMTDGERRHIDIDEDFNISVDGQPLQTLSGSGKSVVNLALRIGLGQVLTSRVLPVFMGDEIDKDMDQGRASATHGTLQSLREYLTQIIIVTHKPDIDADHQIAL